MQSTISYTLYYYYVQIIRVGATIYCNMYRINKDIVVLIVE